MYPPMCLNNIVQRSARLQPSSQVNEFCSVCEDVDQVKEERCSTQHVVVFVFAFRSRET